MRMRLLLKTSTVLTITKWRLSVCTWKSDQWDWYDCFLFCSYFLLSSVKPCINCAPHHLDAKWQNGSVKRDFQFTDLSLFIIKLQFQTRADLHCMKLWHHLFFSQGRFHWSLDIKFLDHVYLYTAVNLII